MGGRSGAAHRGFWVGLGWGSALFAARFQSDSISMIYPKFCVSHFRLFCRAPSPKAQCFSRKNIKLV